MNRDDRAADVSRERIAASDFQPLAESAGRPAGSRRGPLRAVAIAGTAIVVLLVLGFLFTARSVQIAVDSEAPASIDIDGLAVPLGERFMIRSGEYDLHISAPGYVDYAGTLTVSGEASQRLDVVLSPLPGRVTFAGIPEGASIEIDGEDAGRAPYQGQLLDAGDHSVSITAERYLPETRTIAVTGRDIQQTFEFSLQPAWADVSIDSKPSGATVFVDEEAVGSTPLTAEILRGERELRLQAAGYADLVRTLELSAGETTDLGILPLIPAAGLLSLESRPPGANVTVGGEYRGQTPLTVELSPGTEHRIQLSRPGYRRFSRSLALEAGEKSSLTANLEAQLGDVVFDIQPSEAQITLNGEAVGRGPQTLSLPAYEHRVEITLPGHKTERRRVTPREGLQQLVQVTLQTEEEARMARLQPEITTALGQTLKLFNPETAARSEFDMGSSRRDPGRRANEVLHPVRLERLFYLQTTEVTNAQFRQFQESHNSGQEKGNSLNREHQPAVQVSWQQAAAFCNWLSNREGLPPFYTERQGIITGFNPAATGYRLPTEAEWAWVSRVNGDSLQTFSWGDDFPPEDEVENIADASSAYVTGRVLNNYNDGHVVSAPVASFKPNHNGLYDIGGNVAEWMHNVYAIPAATGIVQTDPLGAESGDNYVLRGASWALGNLTELRLTYRDYGQAGRDDVGFRIARYAE
ncbi:PEGA domain-containing protein [Chromatocurvus halotolerans]|uniref:Formylglycine-generating enzyme required for sulfatase activity n=1 Tax=Chromatocurvus halotolerans TaxID=1132028 RepID=A0A4R2KKW7_9GAMM|nr:PEGA domain-containing protein [Chromatocurvus halotolerans]TCO74661.1 formylglycine-generating enzyme required for sulfatase activity [Chromatocurvus halotolerans]